MRLEHVSEFKYLGCVLDELCTDQAECSRKMASGGRVAAAIDAKSLQLECDSVLHESLLMPALTYGSETMTWREKERSRIRALHVDNLRGLLGIRSMNKVPNAGIRQLCGVTKGMEGRLMKVFSDGSAMWREWRMTLLLRGYM